jgi:aspartyl/asparaginyl beta-hydroxylase (cupin superfamily)
MTMFFIVGGVMFWGLLAFAFGSKLLRRLLRPLGIRGRLAGPTLMPYANWLRDQSKGYFWLALRRLRLIRAGAIAPEVIDAHRTTSLSKMKHLRDVMLEVDRLPTVINGKEAMGIDSIFDLALKPPYTIKSAYTAPLQCPPYFIPGVPARTFYDGSEFEWADRLLEAYPVILEELQNVLASDGKGFKAYMSEQQQRLAGWNTFNFFFFGRKVEENCARCPRTTEVLESLPRFERDHIMFSALNPRAHIPPHFGPLNGIIRAHLGLVVPDGCYIKVGNDERTWEAGKLLIFDDSFLHQVWNHSDKVRIVLFMNFWHPCFRPEELPVLNRFRAAYEQTPLSRVHQDNQAATRGHDIAGAPVVAHA